MKTLLLFKVDLTDRHQPSTAIAGLAAVGMMLCLAHAWGWL